MTVCGMLFGGKLGQIFGKRVEIFGGLLLIGIGVKILMEHMA
jgi:putative Mn2+ efflux pump MntP